MHLFGEGPHFCGALTPMLWIVDAVVSGHGVLLSLGSKPPILAFNSGHQNRNPRLAKWAVGHFAVLIILSDA
jgi:hypothetical protein